MQLRFSVVLITPKTHTDVYYDYSLMDFRKVEASQKRILCFSLFLFILTIRNYSNRQKEKKWKNSKEKGNKENMCSGRGLLCAFVAFTTYMQHTRSFMVMWCVKMIKITRIQECYYMNKTRKSYEIDGSLIGSCLARIARILYILVCSLSSKYYRILNRKDCCLACSK